LLNELTGKALEVHAVVREERSFVLGGVHELLAITPTSGNAFLCGRSRKPSCFEKPSNENVHVLVQIQVCE
jgi:hypothetical protein